MYRDDVRGVAGGQQERMQRVGDVERAAGQALGGRPAEAMPGKVQKADGDPAIRQRGSRKIRRQNGAVLPRTREQGQIERVVPRARRGEGKQRGDELMCVLADAASFAERRTIIDQDTHLCKSFRVSILL